MAKAYIHQLMHQVYLQAQRHNAAMLLIALVSTEAALVHITAV